MCQCQGPSARTKFQCANAKCQGHRGKKISHQNQKDVLKTTKSQKSPRFWWQGLPFINVFKTRYRIPFHERCWGDGGRPHIKKLGKCNPQKFFEGEKSKRYGISIQKQGRASRQNPQTIEKLNFGMSSNGLDSSQLRFEHVLGRFRVCKQWVFL